MRRLILAVAVLPLLLAPAASAQADDLAALSVWYAGFHAPFLYKDVTGDFVMTTRVRTAGRQREFPDVEGSLAGLMIREPRPGNAETWKPEDETYLSFRTGLASGPGGRGPALETTITTTGRSALEWRTARAGRVELRIARIGTSFVLRHRFEDGGWGRHASREPGRTRPVRRDAAGIDRRPRARRPVRAGGHHGDDGLDHDPREVRRAVRWSPLQELQR